MQFQKYLPSEKIFVYGNTFLDIIVLRQVLILLQGQIFPIQMYC